jgi:DNA-binding FrmR family transcriptional regulator
MNQILILTVENVLILYLFITPSSFKLFDIPLGVRIVLGMTTINKPVPLPDYDVMSKRLKRIEGQIRGVITMIEDGKDCSEVFTQLSAVKSAFDSAAMFAVVAISTHCVTPSDGSAPTLTADEFRKLAARLA